jgi:hypothetical protein
MSERDWENRLRETALPLPPPEAQPALLRRAEARLRVRRRGQALRWAVVTVIGLLVVVNLTFGAAQVGRLEALGGGPRATAVSCASLLAAWRQRDQLLSETGWPLGDVEIERMNGDDNGPVSDLSTLGARAA